MASRVASIVPIAIQHRDAFLRLVVRDLTDRYLASKMGFVWGILEPASFILLLWIIFSNFRTTPESDVPFLLFLSTGYSVWLFISSGINQSTNVMRQYSFLITKMSFPVWLLPVVKLVSQLVMHWIFLCLVTALLVYEGYLPNVMWLQLIYLQFAAAFLILGISYLTAALNVFYKDVQELVTILMRFGFWLTPIFWSVDLLPESMREWMNLSPFFWLVDGYREVLLYGESVVGTPGTLWFWLITGAIFLVGTTLYVRLRPYFAEIL